MSLRDRLYRLSLITVSVLFLFACGMILISATRVEAQSPMGWEYQVVVHQGERLNLEAMNETQRIVYRDIMKHLNKSLKAPFPPKLTMLGTEGWELVTVLGAIGGDQMWVFKRPLRQ